MNLSLQPNQQQLIQHTLALAHLFELKGYTCTIHKNDATTLYVFDANSKGRIDYTKQANPNWKIVSGDSGV